MTDARLPAHLLMFWFEACFGRKLWAMVMGVSEEKEANGEASADAMSTGFWLCDRFRPTMFKGSFLLVYGCRSFLYFYDNAPVRPDDTWALIKKSFTWGNNSKDDFHH